MNMQFPFKEQGLFRLINSAFLSCSIMFLLGESLGIKDAGVKHMGIVFVVAGLVLLMHYLLAERFIWGVFGCLLLAFLVVVIVGVQVSGDFVSNYVNWLANRPQWNPDWTFYYGIVQICWLVLICYIFQFLPEKEFRIKLVVMVSISGLLFFCMVTEKAVSHIGAGCSIAYILYILTEWTQRKWKKERTQSIASYMNWLLPFMLVYAVILLNMPGSAKPYDWGFVKNAHEWIIEEVRLLSQELFEKEEELDFKFSDFSDEGEMGSSLFSEDRKLMILRSNTSLKTDLYLTGKIFDSFDGRTWMADKEEYPDALYLDTAIFLVAVNGFDAVYSSDYIRTTNLEICYQYLKSDYLFVPLKSWCIEKDGVDVDIIEKDGSMFLNEKQDYKTTFHVNFYQINSESDFFEALQTKEKKEELQDKFLKDLKIRSGVALQPEQFKEYEEFCYNNYLDPVILSDEVREYLEDILRDAETDVEKLRAIEAELASFQYTKEPGEIPDTVTDASTYLDYFLLESKEGYCTHFATAFTLLARSQGIPARYVHGYSVPMQGKKEAAVTSSMAHAWPEVYIEDVGWIPFEPTPGYGTLRYGSWKTKKGSVVAGSQKKYYDRKDVSEEYQGDEFSVLEGDNTSFKKQSDKIVRVVTAILSVLLLGVVLFALEERMRNKYLLSKMNADEQYLFKAKQLFRILNGLNLDRKEEETLTEYRMRIRQQLPGNQQLSFIDGYESVIYGNKRADGTMLEVLLMEQQELLEVLHERKRFRYYMYMIIGR